MASFDLDFLASPEGYKKFFSWDDSVFLIDVENSIDLIAHFFERKTDVPGRGVFRFLMDNSYSASLF